MIILGNVGMDKITGFKGVITGHAKYLYGCDSYCLTPHVDNDGKMMDMQWFDEGRVVIIGEGVK